MKSLWFLIGGFRVLYLDSKYPYFASQNADLRPWDRSAINLKLLVIAVFDKNFQKDSIFQVTVKL